MKNNRTQKITDFGKDGTDCPVPEFQWLKPLGRQK